MPGGVFSTAKLFAMTIRESANDGSDFTNPDADYRRLFLGEDGQLHVKDSAGAVTDIGAAGGVTVEDEGTPLATTATTLDFVGAGVTASGTGASKTITIPGGGGGGTHSFIGYDTIGGSTEAFGSFKVIAKSVTVATDGIITSIGAHVVGVSDSVMSLAAAVYEDNAGTPRYILGYNVPKTDSILPDTASGGGGVTARWLHVPIGLFVPAGTYWIAVANADDSAWTIHYDGSGADRHYTAGGSWVADWAFYTPTTSSNRYSIRASFLEL